MVYLILLSVSDRKKKKQLYRKGFSLCLYWTKIKFVKTCKSVRIALATEEGQKK